jgi:hypothetical protein
MSGVALLPGRLFLVFGRDVSVVMIPCWRSLMVVRNIVFLYYYTQRDRKHQITSILVSGITLKRR